MKINCVLSSAPQGTAAGFAPPFAGPYTVNKKLGYNVYELIKVFFFSMLYYFFY